MNRNQWISAKDTLPEVGQVVLGWSILDNEYVLAVLSNTTGNWNAQPMYSCDYQTYKGITHWQFLPGEPRIVEPVVEVISA